MDLGTHSVIASLPGAHALAVDMTSDFSRQLVAVLFRNPGLLRQQLGIHSDSEREGAEFIFDVCKTVPDAWLQARLRDHAKDELKHSRIYAALSARIETDLDPQHGGDPDGIEDVTREAFSGSLVRFFMSLHVAEIRNRILLDIYLDEIDGIADPKTRARINAAIRTIRADECCHVNYTLPFVMHGLESLAITSADLDKAFSMFRSLFWVETAAVLRMAGRQIPLNDELGNDRGTRPDDVWSARNEAGTHCLRLDLAQLCDDALGLIAVLDAPKGALRGILGGRAVAGSNPGVTESLEAGLATTIDMAWQKHGAGHSRDRRADQPSIEQYFPRRPLAPSDIRQIQSFARSLWCNLAEVVEHLGSQS